MRLSQLAVFGLLFSMHAVCSPQSRGQATSGGKQSSPRKLVLEVLETDWGVGGTNQSVYVRVFSDRSVEYHPKRSQELKTQRVSRGQLAEGQLEATSNVLTREDVAALPSLFESTFTPKDFYWTLDFTIPRGSQSQRIKVVNFSPDTAVQNKKGYPEALVRLVCAAWTLRKQFPTEIVDLSRDCQGFVLQN